MSIEHTDRESAAVAVAPRVSLADIEAAIAERIDFRASEIAPPVATERSAKALGLLSICILVMQNGFTVIGKSAPASPENFNADLGRKFAYEDAIRQLWPLMGFELRERLHKAAQPRESPP